MGKVRLAVIALGLLASVPATGKMMPPPPCSADDDCGPCQACVGGSCVGLGLLECTSDADCGVDEHCRIDELDTCRNHCVSNQCLLVFCAEECDPWGGPSCGAGEACVQSIKGCCGLCEPAGSTCAADADCGPCSSCVQGTCIALPKAPDCVEDTDCAADEYCITYVGAECRNRCASQTCWVVDCMGDCEPVLNPCGPGEACVEPIPGCCGLCQPLSEACTSDADCGACAACVGGLCLGLGDVSCASDADCGPEQICVVDEADPCANHCASVAACTEDAACGPCQVCVNGQCQGTGVIACLSDSDCPAGEVCLGDYGDPCQNQCVPGGQVCVTDTDCGPCEACVEGSCHGLPLLACDDHDDCAADEYCHQVLGEPCANACEPLPVGACRDEADCLGGSTCVMLPDGSGLGDCVATTCATDADCGACGACVNGQCQGTGLVVCANDTDCGDGKRCEIDAEAPCHNACVPVTGEPDVRDGEASSAEGLQPGSDTAGDADDRELADDRSSAGDCSVAGATTPSPAAPLLALAALTALAIVRGRRLTAAIRARSR